MSERNNKPETDLMKPNLKNPPAAGQAATVKPGRADSDFDAAKYTPAPLQRRALTNEQRAQPAVGQPNAGIQSINEAVRTNSQWVQPLRQEMARVIVGQEQLVDRLIVGLLSNGHILLEGVPGLAKTLALKTLASAISLQFQRLQFTPDMLPADIVGTMIYNPRDGSFSTKHGPIFSNLILADEINRAPAKVQSALLEAMQERQVTLGDETYRLPDPFLVLATQNPLEQEGTYPLPEAQVDRFMLKVIVGYPNRTEERAILDAMAVTEPSLGVQPVVTAEDIINARRVVSRYLRRRQGEGLHRGHRSRDARSEALRHRSQRLRAMRRFTARHDRPHACGRAYAFLKGAVTSRRRM